MSSFLAACFRSVSMSHDDLGRLRTIAPILEPHFPELARRFYDALAAEPSTARLLSGPEQTDRLRRTLVEWMRSGLAGPHDDSFYEQRSRIGRRHVRIGLEQHHLVTAMSVVRTGYQDVLLAAYPPAEVGAVLAAVHKLLDVELAIMVHHYQLDSEAKLLERARRSHAERVVAMQTLTTGLAHEVRNPLNAAKLQLELLDRRLRRTHDDVRLTEPSALAAHEIERLTQLMNDFLAFARPPELVLDDRDVCAVVRQACDLLGAVADERRATVEVIAPPAPLVARFDAAKLHHIITHLVANAIEAVPIGGRVIVRLTGDVDAFAVRVEDTGTGIPIDLQGRIYEPFFSTKESGTGLGMSIVYSLVTLHGGTIALDSGKHGTCFEVTIPRRR